ncbi:MAG: hypothetical protein ABDH37_03050 [Candidatus Hydrothermales bacterium]
MRKIILFFLSFCLLYSIEIEGEAKINNFYLIQPDIFKVDSIKPLPYMFHQFEISLKDKKDKYQYETSLLLRLWSKNIQNNLINLKDPSYKIKTHIFEFYLNIYNFPFENLDIKIGKQRISWGTADRLNPTDIINPYDLQNPFDFGKKIPSEAILINFYLPKEFMLEGVFLPKFIPPLLLEDISYFKLFLSPLNFGNIKDTIIFPSLKNPMFASKLYGKILKLNFSLSYFYGFDNFPLFKGTEILIDNSSGDTLVKALYFFPRIHMIGFDLAGEVKSVGIWAELGYFIPIDTVKIWSAFYPFYLLKDPYLKYTAGFDYTFRNGLYVNFQYNYGFFFERYSPDIKNSLHNYLALRIEKKYLRDNLKISLSGIYEIVCFKDLQNKSGYVTNPEISYKPDDNLDINFGLINVHGNSPSSLFYSFKNFDQFYLTLKVNF